MCGITGLHIKPHMKGKLPVGKLMDELLLGIEPRGKEATGFLSVSFDNEINLDKMAVTARSFVKDRKNLKGLTQSIIGHTRLATQGSPTAPENNHPVQYGTVFVTHNGWITNDDELFEQYDLERKAEVDSVAIPAMLWNNGTGFENAGEALAKLQGAMAIAAVDVTRPGCVLLARGHSSPLCWIETNQFFMWASTIAAMRSAWAKVFGTPPKDTKFNIAKEGEMFLLENGKMTELSFTPKVPEYGSFRYSSVGSLLSANPTTGGYWARDTDGTRTYHEYTKSYTSYDEWYGESVLEYGREAKKRAWKPLASTCKKVESYESWIEMDGPIHEDAIQRVAEQLDMDEDTIKWVLFYADSKVIDGDRDVAEFRAYCAQQYAYHYDNFLAGAHITVLDTEEVPEEEDTAGIRQELDEIEAALAAQLKTANEDDEREFKGANLKLIPATTGGE